MQFLPKKKGLDEKLDSIIREMKKANNGNSLYVRAGVYPDSMGLVETSLACDRAKFACEADKNENKSYYTYFDNNMLDQEIKKQYVVNNIDRAIEENWITAFYQPIVRATNGKVCDEEALVRWIDPERGMLSPADFIPILEETRLIYKVDLRMVDIIIERIKKQQQAGLPVVPLSVNLSRIDIYDPNLETNFMKLIHDNGLKPTDIMLEVTESAYTDNSDQIIQVVESLRSKGFFIEMDDFGSGYSSLNMLSELPIDALKLDMKFIRNIAKNDKALHMVELMMEIAEFLKVSVVAEGVETEEQCQLLKKMKCDVIQGFYFSKPLPPEEFKLLIEKEVKARDSEAKEIGYVNC